MILLKSTPISIWLSTDAATPYRTQIAARLLVFIWFYGYSRKVLDRDLERVAGIEPAQPAWKAGVLPLNYTRLILLRPSTTLI